MPVVPHSESPVRRHDERRTMHELQARQHAVYSARLEKG